MSTRDPWDHDGDNHAVALVISNAYRARHGMQSLDVHATVDEDIATAILASDWLTKVKREAAAEALTALIAAVRAIHTPIDAAMYSGRDQRIVKVCTGCGTDDGNWERWPCPTERAIREQVN